MAIDEQRQGEILTGGAIDELTRPQTEVMSATAANVISMLHEDPPPLPAIRARLLSLLGLLRPLSGDERLDYYVTGEDRGA